MTASVFISYSNKNRDVADTICKHLEDNQIECWMAPRNILPGVEWASAIMQGLEEARIMLLVLTEESNCSQQVLREVERAVSLKKALLPVKLGNVKLTGSMEYYLSVAHWIEFSSPPSEQNMRRLAETCRNLLRTLPKEPQTPAGDRTPRMNGNSMGTPSTDSPAGIISTSPEKARSFLWRFLVASLYLALKGLKTLLRSIWVVLRKFFTPFQIATAVVILLIVFGALLYGPISKGEIGTRLDTVMTTALSSSKLLGEVKSRLANKNPIDEIFVDVMKRANKTLPRARVVNFQIQNDKAPSVVAVNIIRDIDEMIFRNEYYPAMLYLLESSSLHKDSRDSAMTKVNNKFSWPISINNSLPGSEYFIILETWRNYAGDNILVRRFSMTEKLAKKLEPLTDMKFAIEISFWDQSGALVRREDLRPSDMDENLPFRQNYRVSFFSSIPGHIDSAVLGCMPNNSVQTFMFSEEDIARIAKVTCETAYQE